MPTKAACPKEVAPPTPVSSTRPSATSAPMPMSFSSETVKLPSTSGASAKRQRRRHADPAVRSVATAAHWSTSSSSSSACVREEGAQHQHRDQQAEHDHVLQRAAPERGEALDHADRERADGRHRVAHQPADDRGHEGLQADDEARVVVHGGDRRDQHADQPGQQRGAAVGQQRGARRPDADQPRADAVDRGGAQRLAGHRALEHQEEQAAQHDAPRRPSGSPARSP